MVISADLMQITVFEVFLNHVQNFTPNSPQYHITLNKAVLGCCAIHCITITYHRGYINIICYITTYQKPTSNPTYVYDFLCDSILKYVTLENKVNLKCDKIVTIHLKYIFIEVYIYSKALHAHKDTRLS